MYLKSVSTLFTKQKTIAPISELLNEILCIPAAQGAAKLLKVKVEGPKKAHHAFHVRHFNSMMQISHLKAQKKGQFNFA